MSKNVDASREKRGMLSLPCIMSGAVLFAVIFVLSWAGFDVKSISLIDIFSDVFKLFWILFSGISVIVYFSLADFWENASIMYTAPVFILCLCFISKALIDTKKIMRIKRDEGNPDTWDFMDVLSFFALIFCISSVFFVFYSHTMSVLTHILIQHNAELNDGSVYMQLVNFVYHFGGYLESLDVGGASQERVSVISGGSFLTFAIAVMLFVTYPVAKYAKAFYKNHDKKDSNDLDVKE